MEERIKTVFQGKKYRITILSEVLIRFEYNEDGKFNDEPTVFAINRNFTSPNIVVKEDNKFINVTSKYFLLEYTKGKPFFASKVMPDTNLRVTLVGSEKMWYFGHPEVRNFRGTTYSLDGSLGKTGLKKGLYSADGFVSFDDSKNFVLKDNNLVLENDKYIDTYLFAYKKDFGTALKSYYTLTGFPTLIPRYALGIWWNKNEIYSDHEIKSLVNKFKFNEIPFGVLLLNNWTSNFENQKLSFTFNNKLYNNPSEFINYLHQNKIFLGLNIDTQTGINKNEEEYIEVSKLLNKEIKGNIPINVLNSNIKNEFINKILRKFINIGVDFFWYDDNSKKDALSLFALDYYTFELYKNIPSKRPMVFSRNAGIAAHRYPILYSGKTVVSFKTLKMLPYFNSNASNIGVSWWSHDIGGYSGGIEDEELFARYVQLGTFSPIFRFSSEKGKYYKREPWKWDIKTLGIVKEYTRLRHSMIPYLYSEAYKYHKIGSPLVQPIYYKYPEVYDEPLYKNEYYFGSEFFISPITDQKDFVMNRVVHRIFLPNGVWYDFKTGKKYIGGKRYVTFYKDEDYPVFVKAGGIIPLTLLNENNLNDTSSPNDLEIHIFPGRNNAYKLYEDDGVSSMYKEGYYIITNIEYTNSDTGSNVIIKPIEGKSGIIPSKRNYKIKFRSTKEINNLNVLVDNYKVNFKKYFKGNDFVVEINNISTISTINVNIAEKNTEIEAYRVVNEEIDEIISDLKIDTSLKEEVANILLSKLEIKKKRIEIRKLKVRGLKMIFIKMFLKLLEYMAEI